MINFFGALKEGLAIVNNLTNGDQSEKRFHVAMRKNHGKALNVAEDIFDLMDAYVAGELKVKAFIKKYRRLRKKFNDLD